MLFLNLLMIPLFTILTVNQVHKDPNDILVVTWFAVTLMQIIIVGCAIARYYVTTEELENLKNSAQSQKDD